MSKKNKAENKRHEQGAPRQHEPAATAEHGPQPRRLTPLRFSIGLGIVVLGAAALLGPLSRDREGAVLPARAVSTTQPTSSAAPPPTVATPAVTTPAVASLPPPAPGTPQPLNDVDPVTGKPLTASSPTLNYKGYVIGFCCASSSGYNGAWASMSESQKDAFVRKYLK